MLLGFVVQERFRLLPWGTPFKVTGMATGLLQSPSTVTSSNKNHDILQNIAVLCNTSSIQIINDDIKEIGDPLETGLLKYAITNNVSILGCISLVHHLETVDLSFFNESASHLLVFPHSASIALILLYFLFMFLFVKF